MQESPGDEPGLFDANPSREDVANSRQARIQLLPVEPPHVGRSEVLELDASKRGYEMNARQPLVALVGGLLHRVFHAVGQPPLKIFVHLQVIGVEK